MAEKLPTLEDFGGEDPIKGKPAKLPSLESLSVDQQEGLAGTVQNYNYSDFKFQPKLGQDNSKLRAQNQSGWEQAGLFLANLVPNIAGAIIENVGYLGSLITEWGDDRDYKNDLTELGKSIKNPFGTIWRENPNMVWDVSDPAWWYSNAESLIESATAFAGVGIGLGKAFSGLGKMLRFGSESKLALKATNKLAHLSTAATLAYTEAAQFGATTYETVFNEQYKKLKSEGVDPIEASDKAKHIASQSAAAAVQLNTMVATALNLTAIAPLFRSNDEILAGLTSNFKRRSGEGFEAWKQRLRATGVGDNDIAKLLDTRKGYLSSYLGESAQEGTEELINQWAEERGLARGKEGKELNGLEDLLSELGSFFDDTMNAKGGLSFVLGAVGGATQTVVIDNIPVHKVYTDENGNATLRQMDAELTEDGKYKVKLVTSRQREKVGNKVLFENAKQAVVNDFKRLEEINKQLTTAIKKGDTVEAERLKFQLFDSAAINSITLGLGQSFASQYEEIAQLDNTKSLHEDLVPQLEALIAQEKVATDQAEKTLLKQQIAALQTQVQDLSGKTEAIQKGFAKSNTDNDYKLKAQKAISDIKEYEALWNQLQAKHSSEDQYHSRYAEYLFSKEVDVRRKDKILKDYAKVIQQNEMQRDSLLSPDENRLILNTVSNIQIANSTREALQTDITKLESSLRTNNIEELRDIAEKYLPNVDLLSDLTQAVPRLITTIRNRISEIDSKFNTDVESLELSENYVKWKEKHQDKNVLDYIKTAYKQNNLTAEINEDKAYWSQKNEELNISKRNLEYLHSRKGKESYIKQARANGNLLAKTIKQKVDQDNKAYIDNLFDGKSVANLTIVQKQQYKESLEREIEQLENRLAGLQDSINIALTERSALLKTLLGRIVNRKALADNKASIEYYSREINAIVNKLKTLNTRLSYLEDPTTSTQEVEELENTTPAPDVVKLEEPNIDTNELVGAIDSYTSNPMQAAGILEALNNYEQELKANIVTFSLNFLDNEGYVGPGKLTQGQAAAIMQVFKEHIKNVDTVQTLIEEEKQPIDPVQAQIIAINEQRAKDLAALKKGSRGVVAKRKAINDAADSKIAALSITEDVSATEFVTEDIVTEDTPFTDEIQSLKDPQLGEYHEGAKTENAAAKINTLTHEYEQDKVVTDTSVTYTFKDIFRLNDNVNPLYLSHGKIKPGSKVKLVVDTAFDGNVNSRKFIYGQPTQVADKFSNYLTAAGSIDIEKVGELPIKIVDVASDTILGYLPTSSWITQKYSEAASDFRNVVDEKYDSKGQLVYNNNVETQRKENLQLRVKLATAFNLGNKEGLDGEIQSRSVGTPLRYSSRRLVNELIPDPKVKLAVARSGAVKTDKNTTEPGVIVNERLNNVPGVLLPAPNGDMVFEPIQMDNLGAQEVGTIIRAIEAYLTLDGDVAVSPEVREKAKRDIDYIKQATDFDISNSDGLTAFINQYYYYTTNFNDSLVRADQKVLKGTPKVPKFMLAISNSPGSGFKKAYIKAGVSFLNKLAKAEIDKNGKLNEDFVALLADTEIGLAYKFRNVVYSKSEYGIKGINSYGPVTEVVYHPVMEQFSSKQYDSYNDLIKSKSTTTLYGKLQLDSGEYVYFAHPNTQLNYQAIMDQQIKVVKASKPAATEFIVPDTTTQTTAKTVFTEAQKEAMRNLTTNMEDDFGLNSIKVVVNAAGEVPGIPLSIENLKEMHNFTPVENRNGKTAIEVFEEMTRLGLSRIPQGHNPFYQCK